ncbi:MAG: MGH1-like glycoside hydrolase domain-containing protein, partial [Bacteroidota bacterium]
SPEYDEDRDGLPQWKHILQTGFEDNPLFDAWHDWSLGVDITQVHSPELESMLYQEAATLIRMAELLGRNDTLTLLHEQAARLRTSIEAMWQPRTGLYHYRDRETGMSLAGKVLVRQQGPGTIATKMKFDAPVRLLIEIQSQNPLAKRPEIRLHQFSTKPADEIVSNSAYQRRNSGLIYTTQKTYSRLAKVLVKGLEETDTVVISTLDFTSEDHTLFMPLWAGVPDEQHAQIMIGRALLDANRFNRPFGIPACPVSPAGHPEAESVFMAVHLPWNLFVCEGLLRYGFRSDAARIMAHFMTAVVQNLKQNRAFFARYHAETGMGIGERNVLTGLAPVGLFLQILGVQILSPRRVRLEGENPFPWEVTVCYRGLKIERGLNKTVITFTNGKAVTITDISPCVVEM